MASRYTYWTIILADGPTSFRARDRDSLVPTLKQLQSRDPKAVLKWFANGRLWDSPEQAREFTRLARMTWQKTRGPEWRPGGEHRDPRDRFKKKPKRAERRPPRPGGTGAGGGDRPGPVGPPRGPAAGPASRAPGKPPSRPARTTGTDSRQRRPYRPTGGTRRGGGAGRGGGRGGGGGRR